MAASRLLKTYRPCDQREASIFHNEITLKPMWVDVMEKFPDRFVIGLDEESAEYRNHPEYVEWMGKLLTQLKPSTARRFKSLPGRIWTRMDL